MISAGTQVGVNIAGVMHVGVITKRTYNPKRYGVYIERLHSLVEVAEVVGYGEACVVMARQEATR